MTEIAQKSQDSKVRFRQNWYQNSRDNIYREGSTMLYNVDVGLKKIEKVLSKEKKTVPFKSQCLNFIPTH